MSRFMNFNAAIQNAFSNDENKYMDFSQLMKDYTNGSLEVTKKQADAKIVEMFRNIIGVDENSTRQEIRKAIRKNEVAVYEIMEEVIEDALVSGWKENPFFKEWVEVRNLALGDKNEFYIEDNSDLSVMRVSGNHWDVIRQRIGVGTTKSIDTYWIAVSVYAEYERILTGAEDFAALVAKIQKAFDKYVNETIYNTLANIGSTLGSQWYKTGTLGDNEKATLMTLVNDVAYASDSEAVIMGTKQALGAVYNLNKVEWASGDMKNEKYTTGRFGYIDGVRIIEIPNGFKKNDTTQYLVNNNILFIMPVGIDPFIKLVYEGDTRMKSVADSTTNKDMTYEYQVQTKLGIGVVTNAKFGMWNYITG